MLPADATATFEAAGNAPTAAFAPVGRAPGGGFDEERRRLLRSRLILVHLLALALGVLIVAVSLYWPLEAEDRTRRQSYWWELALPLGECLVDAVVLWRSPKMSLRSLRLWELAHFGILAAYCGLSRFESLAFLDDERVSPFWLPYWALASLQGFIPLILAYGVLIPNTSRRSLLVVAALTAVPFAALAAATATSPAVRNDFTHWSSRTWPR
jgi:hypothetical protein